MDLMNQKQADLLLAKYRIQFSRLYPTKNLKEAIKISKKIGFPVVLKIASEKIIHKSDIGGVITGIKNIPGLKIGYKKIQRIKNEGIYVQKMLFGRELIIGMKRDLHFGPVIMFGLGGVFVEVLEDISFRVAPVAKKDAINMVKEIKGYEILKGTRGKKPVNIEKISEIIRNLSKLSMKNKNVQQIDLNPVIADEKRAVAVDVRILV